MNYFPTRIPRRFDNICEKWTGQDKENQEIFMYFMTLFCVTQKSNCFAEYLLSYIAECLLSRVLIMDDNNDLPLKGPQSKIGLFKKWLFQPYNMLYFWNLKLKKRPWKKSWKFLSAPIHLLHKRNSCGWLENWLLKI